MVYHVSENGVEVAQPSSWSGDQAIVAFVDGDGEFAPNNILLYKSVQLIAASSPKVANDRWIKQAGRPVTQLAMDLWSQEELLLTGFVLALPCNTRLKPLCRIFLHGDDLPFKLLRDSTSYFGYNPRQCFGASTSVRDLITHRNLTIIRIEDAAKNNDFVDLFRGTRSGIIDVSHEIFQISPNADRLLSNCRFEAVSRWAFDLLLEHYEERKSNAAATFYFTISGLPEAATLKGLLFERQVLRHLFGTDYKYQIRGLLPDSHNMTLEGHDAIRRFIFEDSTVFKELDQAVNNSEPVHLLPSSRNFPAVDSILYNPNDGSAVLTCIQVTVKETPYCCRGSSENSTLAQT